MDYDVDILYLGYLIYYIKEVRIYRWRIIVLDFNLFFYFYGNFGVIFLYFSFRIR